MPGARWRNSRPLTFATPITTTLLVAGFAFSVAFKRNSASPSPRDRLVEVAVTPSGKPSIESATSSVNKPRRATLMENCASAAAEFVCPGRRAVTPRRGKEVESTKGNSEILKSMKRLNCSTTPPSAALSALT